MANGLLPCLIVGLRIQWFYSCSCYVSKGATKRPFKLNHCLSETKIRVAGLMPN